MHHAKENTKTFFRLVVADGVVVPDISDCSTVLHLVDSLVLVPLDGD